MLSQLQQKSSFGTKKRRWKKIPGGRAILLLTKESIRAVKKEEIDLKQCTLTFLLSVNTGYYSSFTNETQMRHEMQQHSFLH